MKVSFFYELSIPWYALAMFAWYLMTMFLQQFNKKHILLFSIALACAAGYDKNIGGYACLSRILVFYPYFLAGFWLDPERIVQFTRRRGVKLFALILLAILFLVAYRYIDQVYWTMEVARGRLPYTKMEYFKRYGAAFRLLQYAVSGLLTFAVIALIPEKRFPWSVLGQRTLSVYALHSSCMDIFYSGLHGHRWLRALWPEHYRLLLIAVAVLLVAVLSLKPFYILVCRIIIPGKEKKNE